MTVLVAPQTSTPGVVLQEVGPTPMQALEIYQRMAEQQMREAMQIVQREVVFLITPHTRTGNLARSISYTVARNGKTFTGSIGTNVRYGKWLDQGTGIYGPSRRPIVPTKARALRFPQPGNSAFSAAGRPRRGKAGEGANYVVVKSVKGVKPMRFFEDGIDNSRSKWIDCLQQIAPLAALEIAGGKRK